MDALELPHPAEWTADGGQEEDAAMDEEGEEDGEEEGEEEEGAREFASLVIRNMMADVEQTAVEIVLFKELRSTHWHHAEE